MFVDRVAFWIYSYTYVGHSSQQEWKTHFVSINNIGTRTPLEIIPNPSQQLTQTRRCIHKQQNLFDDSAVSQPRYECIVVYFYQDACVLLGLPMESPLAISVNAGTKALGPLMHITGVMLQKHVAPVWGAKDELPVR